MKTNQHITISKEYTAAQWLSFWSKVEIDHDTECFNWTGCKNENGYGYFTVGSRPHLAHRVAYSWFKEHIPKGMILDHTCDNPSCVNPMHLEPVTNKENILRGLERTHDYDPRTHFKCGHPRSDENTYRHTRGDEHCKICTNKKATEWARNNKDKVAKIRARVNERHPGWRTAYNKAYYAKRKNPDANIVLPKASDFHIST